MPPAAIPGSGGVCSSLLAGPVQETALWEGVFPESCALKTPRREGWLALLQKRQNNKPHFFFP